SASLGSPGKRPDTSLHVLPPSRVTCTRPSSVPTHITLESVGARFTVRIVLYVSAPEMSYSMGPPLVTCFALSFRVRSGLRAVQPRLEIDARDVAVLRIHVENGRVARRGHGVLPVAPGHGEPLRAIQTSRTSPTSPTSYAARRPAPRVVVLQSAAQHVGRVVVGGHHVELLDRQIIEVPPALCAGLRHVGATVVPLDHAVGILGVDPQRVVIHVYAPVDRRGGLAAVVRA